MRATITILLAIAAIAAPAQEAPDTIAAVNNASELTVVRTAEGLKIEIQGQKDNPRYYYEYSAQCVEDSTDNGGWGLNLPFLSDTSTKSGKRKASLDFDVEIYAGTSIPTGATPMGASFEIGISRVLNGNINFGGGFSFNAGIGFGYVQYAVGDGMRFTSDRQNLLFAPRRDGTYDNSSRLRMFRVHFPLTFTQMLSRKFHITAGAWLNLNTSVWASSTQTAGSVKTTESYKDLHQRDLTTDVFLAAGFRNICGIYARYCPQSLFRNGRGPAFESVNIGVIFNL